MNKRINPNLLKLAELTHNPDLKIDKDILEKKVGIKPSDAPNLVDYIYVPSIKLYVAKEKTLYGKDWYEAHEELHKQGLQMLTIRQFIDFVNYLKSNPQLEDPETILDEILTPRESLRSEWLDADFKVINEKLHINYNHRTINGELEPLNSEPLEDCLMKNNPRIDLEYWLKNPTKHGLPPRNNPDGELFYWCPVENNNSVAGFGAYSGGAFLCFDRNPGGSDSLIWVRAAKTKN